MSFRRRLVATSALIGVGLLAAGQVWAQGAGPTGGVVTNGGATITNGAGQTTINQTTGKAILEWQRFGVDPGATVRFVQPDRGSVALNRVRGAEASRIDGNLTANGQVFIVNPNGVMIGGGGRVDVGGFVASTHDIRDQDFMAGRMRFDVTSPNAQAVTRNDGQIRALDGGYAVLIGSRVENSGTIAARLGQVGLAAGDGVALDLSGDGLLQFQVTKEVARDPGGALITNSGRLSAPGGTVQLSAMAVHGITRDVINTTGMIDANDATVSGGRVFIHGGDRGVVNLGGEISAGTGTVSVLAHTVVQQAEISANGPTGGTISIQGADILDNGRATANGATGAGGVITHKSTGGYLGMQAARMTADGATQGGQLTIEARDKAFVSSQLSAQGQASGSLGGRAAIVGADIVLAAASINVSGDRFGGAARIGGEYQGGVGIRPAATTVTNATTRITADARGSGWGGSVVVWSEIDTLAAGTISARGSISGGLIEVSSKGQLRFGAEAETGPGGRLLLDPKFIIIDAAANAQFLTFPVTNPDTGAGGDDAFFGSNTVFLANGNFVVSNRNSGVDGITNRGVMHLFNGANGALISTVRGSTTGDQVGFNVGTGVSNLYATLPSGNLVVVSQNWRNGTATNAGAATWINGTTGLTGVISATNSLVGSSPNDGSSSFVQTLSNGNYIIGAPFWQNGAASFSGAVAWGNGATGLVGAISATNALVGSTSNDQIGQSTGVRTLSNGNYIVASSNWDNGAAVNGGMAALGRGTGGTVGAVSASNALVGTANADAVGSGITTLTNGNFVIVSAAWNNGTAVSAGAVTWVNGSTGLVGPVSVANSLVGTSTSDQVGLNGVTTLTNGNYVVASSNWRNGGATQAGAATWGNGSSGTVGSVSAGNSLTGTTVGNSIGSGGVFPLTNGNYVVLSPSADVGTYVNNGAATLGMGTGGTVGAVTMTNSLFGTTPGDLGAPFVQPLANGNYVLHSQNWDNGTVVDAGAFTWGNGTQGVTGPISVTNSLLGATAGDFNSFSGIITFSNGNYLIRVANWDNGTVVNVGAVVFGNGTQALTGLVSATNALIGTTAQDGVGSAGAVSGNAALILSSSWDNGATGSNAGAATWISGTGFTPGPVSSTNSLIGSAAGDSLGTGFSFGARGFLIRANNSMTNVGAISAMSTTGPLTGVLSATNSLMGSSSGDQIGLNRISLSNGNFVTFSTTWRNGTVTNAGAVTFIDPTAPPVGFVSASNSLVGSSANDGSAMFAGAVSNGRYVVSWATWNNGTATRAGAISLGDVAGTVGIVSTANSLVGTTTNLTLQVASTNLASVGSEVIAPTLLGRSSISGVGSAVLIVNASAANQTFGLLPSSTISLRPSVLTTPLSGGTAVTLQASSDITINSAINVTGANGGALTLQAGRSILINASITTANGNLTLVANESVAAGVIDAQRDPGAAAITMAAGTSINVGTGALAITLKNSTDKTNNTGGSISLGSLTAGTIDVRNLSTGNAQVILNSGATLTASGSGNAIVLATAGGSGDNIVNNSGASALVTPAGRWILYSADPRTDTLNGLTGTRRYGRTIAANAPAGVSESGNLTLYSLVPTLTITATSTSIIAGSTLPTFTFTVSGLIAGDSLADALSGNPLLATATPGTIPGTFTITASLGSLQSILGYNFVFVPGTLTVTPAVSSSSSSSISSARSSLLTDEAIRQAVRQALATNPAPLVSLAELLLEGSPDDPAFDGVFGGPLLSGRPFEIVGPNFDASQLLANLLGSLEPSILQAGIGELTPDTSGGRGAIFGRPRSVSVVPGDDPTGPERPRTGLGSPPTLIEVETLIVGVLRSVVDRGSLGGRGLFSSPLYVPLQNETLRD